MNDANLTADLNCFDIAIYDANTIYVGTSVKGIFKTTDGGLHWTPMNNGITYGGGSFPNDQWAAEAVAVDPTNPNNVYCGVANAYLVDIVSEGPNHPGFYRSANGGASWVQSNSGLPAMHDPIWDNLESRTFAVASLLVLPQYPNVVVMGGLDADINAKLLFGTTAVSQGKVYYSMNRGVSWTAALSGLPTIQESSGFGSLTRLCGSLVYLSCAPTGSYQLYASHLGIGANAYLDTTISHSKSKGVFKYEGSSWVAKNNGLPVVNDAENVDATNAGPVAVSPLNSNILLAGVSASDGSNPNANLSKVYASQDGGASWMRMWDQGMLTSPHGYTEANPIYIDFNSSQTAVFSSVAWSNVDHSAGTEDDGVWRLPPRNLKMRRGICA